MINELSAKRGAGKRVVIGRDNDLEASGTVVTLTTGSDK